MMIAGGADTIAPALLEQIEPFTTITTPEKYLLIMKNGTHFSTLIESDPNEPASASGSWPVPDSALGESPELARYYMDVLAVPFFEKYIADRPEYQRYLQESYVKTVSREPLPVTLIRSLTSTQLKQAINSSN